LRQQIARFALVEVHAPFRIELHAGNLAWGSAELAPVLALAGDLGAGVVTVHARIPEALTPSESADWLAAMQALSAEAAGRGLTVGLEIVEGFDAVKGWGLTNIGVALDIGHMHIQEAGRAELARLGGLDGVVRHLGPALIHLHVHDVVAGVDHCEVGTGMIDFEALIAALWDIGYSGGLCLELNPDRVSPEGIRRSREHLRSHLGHG
jgi:sugar phosphate isomerase/epimerase